PDARVRSPHAGVEPALAREGPAHGRAVFPAARRLARRRGDLPRYGAEAGARGRLAALRRASPAAGARFAPLPRARPPDAGHGPPDGRRGAPPAGARRPGRRLAFRVVT